MEYQNLIVETQDKICVVSLNRPQALNALNQELLKELSEFLDHAKTDAGIGSIILTGSGEKAFAAGADIKELAGRDRVQGEAFAKNGHETVFDKIEQFNKPIIAAINGFALGGGLELAMACHFRLASSNAKMGLPEVSLGLVPGYGGSQRLPQLVGKGWANQIMLSAQMIDAATAERIGLVNSVCQQSELIGNCKSIAQKILNNAPNALEKVIELVNVSGSKEGFQKEIKAFGALFEHPNFTEGTTAFIEKRKAEFQ